MKKILYIHPSLITGGAERLRYMFLKLIDENKYDISLCCIEKKGTLGEKIEKMGYRVDCLNMSSKPYNLLTVIALFRYLKKNKFDIVQTSLFNANFHGRIAAILAGVPVIISEEHSEHYQYNSFKFVPYILMDKILSFFTHKIICCCANVKSSISRLEHIPEDKFKVIINAIDCREPVPGGGREEARKIMGVNESDIVIGNVSMLCRRKMQSVLVEAFAEVVKSHANAKLVFIGEEYLPAKEELVVLAQKLNVIDKIIFMGRRDDVYLLLKGIDIFVLSSLHEGIPLAFLEAMFTGVPVISTDVGGVSEVIKHNINGILLPAGASDKMAAAIKDLIGDPGKRHSLSQKGRETVLRHHTAQRYVDEMCFLYSDLDKKRKGGH